MKNIKTFLILSMILPRMALAQGEGVVMCKDATDCDIDALAATIYKFISFWVQTGLVVAALAFAYAGWLFMSANGKMDQIKRAKNIFWRVLVGVILIMSAFLVVQIILNSVGFKGDASVLINKYF